ncbi:M1 family metallopeptidase [Simiduia agarivorans]|uniref:Aminopeptidase N n=1 Tax=Simiduia agarivorans (strain DSM 21679 / JCM 13881 / BCRC 17597 / SA1) TaxID=1117647 RepID=K4KIW9_SIMAS|nr:M1 family metallopeptidase [Simiduia agarivorans]AFU99094.1 cold-active aminopeptidase [Simiduia agarivorans SA1 = DSM 21679]
MSRTFFAWVLLICTSLGAHAATLDPSKDYHSQSNPHQIKVTHFALDLNVDFKKRELAGHVVYDFERKDRNARELLLDTRDITVIATSVRVDGKWQKTGFKLEAADPALGSALRIAVPEKAEQVKVQYRTSPAASGLQWLQPEQTASKKHPFLFTQAQAIHARSFIPSQDTPQVRTTYDAILRTPKNLRAVMSAENTPNAAKTGTYQFHMPQAIPSYLIALAVGDLDFKAMGDRTGVYAEPALLDAAVAEFEDTESMLIATEKAYGPYSWGRYDLLILPPSFPFGGMENPRLSFITPTVIAGDKSLVSLIAHELAHSWSGNTVTNATWRDLWLNEGHTTYLTYRIMEIIYGTDRFNMESVLGYQDLTADLADLPANYQHLAIDLRGKDPDDAFSDVPYEKGALFLKEIEQRIGRAAFDAYLKQYFADYAFKSLSTEDWLAYAQTHLIAKHPSALSLDRFKAWIYAPGLPADHPLAESDAFTKIDRIHTDWLAGAIPATAIDTKGWTVHQWLYFLNNLPEQLSPEQMSALDSAFNLTASTNNEIAHSWLLMAIRNQYQPAYARLETYLVSIGRRKLITPLYRALMESQQGQAFARKVYAEARPGYHPLAQGTMDAIVNAK